MSESIGEELTVETDSEPVFEIGCDWTKDGQRMLDLVYFDEGEAKVVCEGAKLQTIALTNRDVNRSPGK